MTSAQGWSLRTVIQFHQTLFILSLFYFHFAFLFISEILKKKKTLFSDSPYNHAVSYQSLITV